jgi:hypothetical protein
MDATSFDHLTRRLGATSTRRVAFTLLVGMAMVAAPGFADEADARPKRRKSKRKGKRRKRQQSAPETTPRIGDCFNPGTGRRLDNCDFSGQDLVGFDFGGSVLHGASFVGANLCGANFGGTGLVGANFSNANLRKANFFGSSAGEAISDGALFCGTILPEGDVENFHCTTPVGAACCRDFDCMPYGGTTCRPNGQCCLPNGRQVGNLPDSVCCSNKKANGVCVA